MRSLVFLFTIFITLSTATGAEEPFFKPNDVVALVGGEDMVVAAELGYLETLIQLALPDHHLKFRSLAREGDTVFEQRRDLNYPKLEDQLDKIGATVVICQFGQMESLAAMDSVDKTDKVDRANAPAKASAESAVHEVHEVHSVQEKAEATRKAKAGEFVAGYGKLIARLKGKDGARRIVVVQKLTATDGSENSTKAAHASNIFPQALVALQPIPGVTLLDYSSLPEPSGRRSVAESIRFGSHSDFAEAARSLANNTKGKWQDYTVKEDLRALITAKNRLWYYYYRPQNWAFLAGDRTNQPSSRDHLDPSKRWFPEELEKFVPLIDAKDAEIWALAKKLQ